MMGSGLMQTQPLNLQNTLSTESLGSAEEQAPRIDEIMSSHKRRGGQLPEYRLDAAYLLGSRLEIQILKRLKASFFALCSNNVVAMAGAGRHQQQSSAYFARKEDTR